MTEQEFEQVKGLLKAAPVDENSSSLDEQILSAARHHSALASGHVPQGSWLSQFLRSEPLKALGRFLQSGFIPSAAVSLALTVAVFFGFGQLLSIETQPPRLSVHEVPLIKAQISDDAKQVAIRVDSKQEIVVVQKPELELAREQIVAQMTLPDIQVLLNTMAFGGVNDRQLAESALRVAMHDIRQLLDRGNVMNARERYAQLRQMCVACTLPDSLEGLALVAELPPQPTLRQRS